MVPTLKGLHFSGEIASVHTVWSAQVWTQGLGIGVAAAGSPWWRRCLGGVRWHRLCRQRAQQRERLAGPWARSGSKSAEGRGGWGLSCGPRGATDGEGPGQVDVDVHPAEIPGWPEWRVDWWEGGRFWGALCRPELGKQHVTPREGSGLGRW